MGAGVLLVGQALQDRRAEDTLNALRPTEEAVFEETEHMPPSAEGSGESETSDTLEPEASETISDDFPTEDADTSEEQYDADMETAETDISDTGTPDEPPAAPNPYAEVFASYEDVAAWLVVPGTIIDYPVVWTPADENQYLYLDIDGNEDKNGSLILDTDSCVAPVSTNLIIHGHNMRSGAMFGNLTDYESQDFCEEHKQITLYTEECQRNYEVIAVFRSQVYKKKDEVFKYYKFFQANNEEEFEDFYQNIKNLSLYDTGVTAEYGDRFITLSTCVYHVTNGRFVVVAKEVEGGDTYLPVAE